MTTRSTGQPPELPEALPNPDALLQKGRQPKAKATKPPTPKATAPSTPVASGSKIPNTNPNIPCYSRGHICLQRSGYWHDYTYYTTETIDFSWLPCKQQPCPNRYLKKFNEEELSHLPPAVAEQCDNHATLTYIEKTRIQIQEEKAAKAAASSSSPPPQPTLAAASSPPPSQPTSLSPKPGSNNPTSERKPASSPSPPPATPKTPPAKPPKKEDNDSDSEPSDSDSDNEDEDDEMSKVKKAFEGISKLHPDGSNWAIVYHRIKGACRSLGNDYLTLLENAPGTASLTKDGELQYAITLLIPDSIFYRYLTKTTTKDLIAQLVLDFGTTNTFIKSKNISDLFTTKCTQLSKLNQHLDYLIKV